MSIKDLFNNPGAKKIQKSVTSDEMVEPVESEQYVEAKRTEFEQFVPPIDFASASNFAKFGSAELYYEKSFERIHQYYPYDGTLAEKAEFHNSASYLDKYVFDNLYPRTNGYVTFNGTSQYITVDGGPHTASAGMIGKVLDDTFDSSMIYDETKKRTSAFEFRGDDGVTIEFWLKVPNTAANRTIMHVTGAASGEIKLSLLSSDTLQVAIGRNSLATQTVNVMTGATSGTNWNHFAVSIQSSSAGLTFKSYKNGQYNSSVVKTGAAYNMSSILPVSDGLKMTIGADKSGANKITGSLDEFRYWKSTRTPEAIFNTWFIPVGGGTNKHDSNISLGLYFKFNEGITGTQSIDKVALDYSGRINNGTIVGYASGFRNTGSAITEKLSEPEYLEPIIYSTHPDVISKKAEYKTSGSLADNENSSMLLSYFPGWMQEEDEQNGKQLKYLAQVMGSYFDTLWHQINFVDRIHDNHYISGSNKALPFAKKLLYDRGFVVPDLFVDATITENLLKKDDNEVYEKQINEVRNTIYHNLYNNLETIYKSKGTEKSFRNFFRSLGIGQDVVKLRMYADDSTFVLRNNYEHKSFERKYLNFNYEGHFDATLYQTSSANNSNIYVPGDSSYLGSLTFESEIVLPRKNRSNEIGYLPFTSLTASVKGFHTRGTDYTHPGTDRAMSVYVLKEKLDSNLSPDDSHRVRFMLTGAFGELISSVYSYQYENNKWNLAVRLRHENYPYANVTGNVANNYVVEFYGVEADGNTKRNSFSLSKTVTANHFSDNKIFYAGAHRTNFTGSSLYNTDIKLGFVRYWHSYLSNEAIDQHAYDSETFGANEPFENDLVNTYPIEIPREKTLGFHWAFNNLTTSDSSGEVLVSDLSSGSTANNYGSLSSTIDRYVQGKAEGFNNNATNALDKLYIQTARKRLPDDLMSSDLTTIKSDETEQFFVDDDVSDNFYSFEKSMYGVISDEMMNMFSTALDLNNLIGQPNQKYHHRYNMADFLRDRFYDDVENEPSIDKFTSFYKWIDDSISIAVQQLVPASARFSEKINNIIESHVLERNKYVHQVPILTTFQSTEGSIKGISEMKYDWKHGHAPFFPEEEQTNALWQRERKKKSGLRETLRVSRNNHSLQSSGLMRKEIDGSTRISDVYAVRKFAKTYDLSLVSHPSIHGGVNFKKQKNIPLFHESIAPGGAIGAVSGVPQNIITVGVGSGNAIAREARDDDNLPRKQEYSANTLVGNLESSEYGHKVQGSVVLPLSLMSGTVHTGFNSEVKTNFGSDVVVSNLHHDSVGRHNDRSIQGPFTEAHVGGLQYRHVDINKYDTSKSVSIRSISGGTFPTASIKFTASVLSTKLAAGTGSSVTVRDGDGTIITATYSNVYDLYDNQWTSMDELVFIMNNKLNMTTNKINDGFLALTQSVTGNFYNYTIQSSSHGFITASGFGGGSAITYSTTTQNVDGPSNRPEGWGLVFKDHPSQGDSDGAFGFISADYATPYPSPVKAKATRYREETAKRPVNIRNIKTTSTSQKAGNYSNEIQLFSLSTEHQRGWLVGANEDSNIDILPPFISESLPSTTNYQTLIGISPLNVGNIFGEHQNNRQPDGGVVTPATAGTFATGSFVVTGSPSPAIKATGSFVVTGSHTDGTVASGSFRYYSSDTQGFQAISDYNNIFIQSLAGLQFVLTASAASNAGIQRFFVTGANSGSSYSNLRNKINAEANLNSSYAEVIPTNDYGLEFVGGSHNEGTNPALSASTNKYDDNGYTWVFNVALSDPASSAHDEYIMTSFSSAGGKPLSQEFFISSSDDLVYRIHYTGGQTRTYTTGSIRSVMQRNMTNFVLAHTYSGGAPALGDLKITMNGQELTLTMASAGGAVSPADANRVRANGGIFLFSNKGAGNTNWAGTGSVTAYFKEQAGTNMRQYLYNQGYYKDYSGVRAISGSLVTQWKLADGGAPTADGDVLVAFTGSDMINLTASLRSGVGDRIRRVEFGGLAEDPYAIFSVTSSITGSSMNSSISPTITIPSHNYFKSLSNMQGATNQSGLIATNKVTVGSKNFVITSTHTADSPPNYYIAYTGSSANIWNALQAKIIANTNVTEINRTNTGAVQSIFRLTSSNGSAGNEAVSVTNPISPASFSTPTGMAGGANSGSSGGIQNGDKLTYDTAGSPKNFIFSYTAQSDSAPNYYVITTGSSSQIWTALENKIQTVTGDTVNVNTSAGHQASFAITASATGSAGNKALSETGTSITSPLGMLGGTSMVPATYALPDVVITRPRTDLTSSERNINTRFSAPGGPEIQTIGYLDAHTQTYSVHNAMPFRNLSVLGSGSGESATIRVEDHLGKRRGLKTLRALHMGQFGIDSQYGAVTSTSYPSNGSSNKQHRNTSERYEYGAGTLIITGSAYDNMHINSSIPRSEFQYSWIKSATSGSNWRNTQTRVRGYAPRDGMVSASAGYVEAIIFPSASSIVGSYS